MTKQVNLCDELYELIERVRVNLEKELDTAISFSQASKTFYYHHVTKEEVKPVVTDQVVGQKPSGEKVRVLDFKDFNLFK